MWQITLTISVVTLDGHETFHVIRIIAVSSHKGAIPLLARPCTIERLKRATVNEIVKDKGLPTIQYIGPAEKAQL